MQRRGSAIDERDGPGYRKACKEQKKYCRERFHDILRAARVSATQPLPSAAQEHSLNLG
jgi:hypothetical protein